VPPPAGAADRPDLPARLAAVAPGVAAEAGAGVVASPAVDPAEVAAVTSVCRLPGCERESRSAGALCELHRKRAQRGVPPDAPVRERLGPREALLEAALAYADVEAGPEHDLAWALARERLFVAAKRYARVEQVEVGDNADPVPHVG
jgi:hypothetical protein